MEMQMTLEVITPEAAKKLLEYNTNNRVPRRNNVAKIADDIENGRWKVTGETIKFSNTRLIDGQNRLMAVVQAGRPIKTWVARNVDDEAFAVCDTGVTRTPADILNIAGHKHAHVKSTAVKIVRFYMDRKTDISTKMSTQINQEVVVPKSDCMCVLLSCSSFKQSQGRPIHGFVLQRR